MGDRITIFDLKCAYCGAVQKEVFLAPSCGFKTHKCVKCKKENLISLCYGLMKK